MINIIIFYSNNPGKNKVSFHRIRIKMNQNQKFISKIDEEETSKMRSIQNRIKIILCTVRATQLGTSGPYRSTVFKSDFVETAKS